METVDNDYVIETVHGVKQKVPPFGSSEATPEPDGQAETQPSSEETSETENESTQRTRRSGQ